MLACLSPNGMNRYDGASAPDRLLVATSSGVTTLARESSGAWRKAGTALANLHATTLTVLPGRPGIFVGTHGDGVLFSEDGAHWEERNSGLAIKNVYTVASVAEAGGLALYAGTQPAALFKSRDLGQSWSELPALRQVPGTEYWTFPEPPHIAHTKMMVFDPRTPQRIYAAIEQGALLKTEDGGQSWRELADYSKPDDGAYRDVHQVMLVPSRPDTVFMTTGVGLYRSSDGGDHWERLTGEEFRIAYPDHMMLSPDEKILFMSGAKFHPGFWIGTYVADTTIVRSRDHGRSWDTEPKGFAVAPCANIEALIMACWPGGYALFVGDTEGTVHMSEDGGDSWTRIADEVGCVTKGNHAAALRGEIRPRAAAAAR
jgi:photosystem II stability/assembly factor-like uncharacterized protein